MNYPIGIILPKIKSMMTGVYRIEVSPSGIATLFYTDQTKEYGQLSEVLTKQVKEWAVWQSGKSRMEVEDQNVFSIVSEVQDQRKVTT